MSDVVSIAKKCRQELNTEIARLDEFIRMAEKLMKYEQLASATGAGDNVELTPGLASASVAPDPNSRGAKA